VTIISVRVPFIQNRVLIEKVSAKLEIVIVIIGKYRRIVVSVAKHTFYKYYQVVF